MTGKTHKAMGICVGIAITYWGIKAHGNPIFAISTIASAVGAMLPDIDHNNSKLGAQRKAIVDKTAKMTAMLSGLFGFIVIALCGILAYSKMYTQIVILLLLIILPVIILSAISQIPAVKKTLRFVVKHRGIMHTLAIPLLFFLGFMLISNEAVRFALLAVAAGYMSHLILDCLTKMGCPILWPIYSKNISLLSIRTGTMGEYVVSYTLAIALLVTVFFGTPIINRDWDWFKIPTDALYITNRTPMGDAGDITKEIYTSLDEIILWHDGSAALYESTLSATSAYLSNPTEEHLNAAADICAQALERITSISEISIALDEETINKMQSLNIDEADFYTLYDIQGEYKSNYISGINEFLYYLSYAPLFDTEFKHVYDMKRNAATADYKAIYLLVNSLLLQDYDGYKAFLIENGFTENEADERINKMNNILIEG